MIIKTTTTLILECLALRLVQNWKTCNLGYWNYLPLSLPLQSSCMITLSNTKSFYYHRDKDLEGGYSGYDILAVILAYRESVALPEEKLNLMIEYWNHPSRVDIIVINAGSYCEYGEDFMSTMPIALQMWINTTTEINFNCTHNTDDASSKDKKKWQRWWMWMYNRPIVGPCQESIVSSGRWERLVLEFWSQYDVEVYADVLLYGYNDAVFMGYYEGSDRAGYGQDWYR